MLELYREILDSREPTDEFTKSLRHNDVDALQAIISRMENNGVDMKVPFNFFEDFLPCKGNRIINYAGAYGSVKCFKYLLLNNHLVDKRTFTCAVYGGNAKIIKIVDQQNVINFDNADLKKRDSFSSFSEKNYTYFQILCSIIFLMIIRS